MLQSVFKLGDFTFDVHDLGGQIADLNDFLHLSFRLLLSHSQGLHRAAVIFPEELVEQSSVLLQKPLCLLQLGLLPGHQTLQPLDLILLHV